MIQGPGPTTEATWLMIPLQVRRQVKTVVWASATAYRVGKNHCSAGRVIWELPVSVVGELVGQLQDGVGHRLQVSMTTAAAHDRHREEPG